MQAPRVRAATPVDAEQIADVAAATFGLACPPDTLPESIEHFVSTVLSLERFGVYLSDPARELLVAEEGTGEGAEIVGYTMLVHGEPADPDVASAVSARPTAELSKCYVLPTAHGSGVAGALVEATVASAAVRGATSVWLGVNQLNARANRFYDKHGFARVGTKRFQVGQRLEHDFVRERPVVDAPVEGAVPVGTGER